MNRKAVPKDESTGHTRKNPREIHEDPIMRAWLEAQTAETRPHDMDQWTGWKDIERHVLRLQRQLAHAVKMAIVKQCATTSGSFGPATTSNFWPFGT